MRAARVRLPRILVLVVPLACDTFSEPSPLDLGAFEPAPLFCPTVTFESVTAARALRGPLFAWVTEEERLAIEAGGPVLRELPTLDPTQASKLVAAMHDTSAIWAGQTQPLVGQPRVGRGFWTFAFAAPRASTGHDQLLAVWLRPDAWLGFHTTGQGVPAHDASGKGLFDAEVDKSPGRVAGADTNNYAECLREGSPERSFVLFREEAIERIVFGPEAKDRLEAELELVERLFVQLRTESLANPEDAFDYSTCGSRTTYGLCPQNTYVQAIAWTHPMYLPTVTTLARLIDGLRDLPVPPAFALERTTAEDLAAWTAVWPGPWRDEGSGMGGASGAGGLGGSGG